jgi:hypothetical protein
VNWTIIEPGIYLLSACALSFKPFFRMFAQALHLQAFLSHTKSTLSPGKRQNIQKNPTTTDIHMQPISGRGKFYRLSEDGEDSKGDKKIEILITTTVDVGRSEFVKDVGMVV